MKKLLFLFLIVGLFINSYLLSDVLKNHNHYRIVAGDKVNVRTDHNSKSTAIIQLRIGKMIKFIHGSGMKEKIGSTQGEWVYIDTLFTPIGSEETLKGWILDYYLADFNNFQRVSKFSECIFNRNIGETILYYEFYQNGKYKRRDKDDKGRPIYMDGSVYRYRDLIIAKDDNKEFYNYFFINGNQLCYAHRNLKGEVECISCKSR